MEIMRRSYRKIFLACAVGIAAFGGADVAAQAKRAPAATSPQFRTITVVTEPGANVWIDGVGWGKTDKTGKLTIKTLSSGGHTLRVRANGFKEKSQPLTAVQKGELTVVLAPTTDEADLAFQEAERLAFSDREKAAEAYRKAIKLRPNFPEAQVALARVLAEMGDVEEALAAVTTARKLRPGYAEASAVEGRIRKDSGEDDKAIGAFRRAITEGKGFQPEAYAGLGLFYKEKAEGMGASGDFDGEATNYAEAARYLKTSLKQLSGAPDTVVIYQLLGLVYERQKKTAEAIAVYEEFLRMFPDSSEATAVRSFIVQLKKGDQ
jgi:tetratricopeptide (TPR) repeat protein